MVTVSCWEYIKKGIQLDFDRESHFSWIYIWLGLGARQTVTEAQRHRRPSGRGNRLERASLLKDRAKLLMPRGQQTRLCLEYSREPRFLCVPSLSLSLHRVSSDMQSICV